MRAVLFRTPLLAALLAITATASAAGVPRPAERVLQNGAIYTVDAARSRAQAIAIRGGRIVFVGSDRDAAAWIGPRTQVNDLGGRLVLPGIQDAHIHPINSGIDAIRCDLSGGTTEAEYLAKVADCARAAPAAPWISGGGWLSSAFPAGARPRREALDRVLADRPVFLINTDGHTAWVNSRALALAGVDARTADPADGRIDRDPDGSPSGSLQEGAQALVTVHMPVPGPEERRAGLLHAMRMLNAYGITAIQDANVGEADLQAYEALDRAGELGLRVTAALWWERERGTAQIEGLRRLRERYTRGRVRATSVKIMQDGVMENYTAALLEPYLLPQPQRGIARFAPPELASAVSALDADGFQVHFHAIGDAATRQCLDAVEAARAANGARGNRHHISHLQLVDPADIPRFRELDVAANFQPLWAFADEYITRLTTPFIGAERSARMYPIRSLQASGAMVVFGSDWSVSSANPWEQIEVALTRMGPQGETHEPFAPAERIGLPEAVAAFTIAAAWVNGIEAETGSIEPGKRADLVVLDRDIFAIDTASISATRALLTLLDGTPVHGSFASLRAAHQEPAPHVR